MCWFQQTWIVRVPFSGLILFLNSLWGYFHKGTGCSWNRWRDVMWHAAGKAQLPGIFWNFNSCNILLHRQTFPSTYFVAGSQLFILQETVSPRGDPFPGKQTPGKLPISATPATGLDKGNISCKLRALVVIRDGFIPFSGGCALVCHPAVNLGGDSLFCCLLHSTPWTINLHLIHAVFIGL